MGCPQLAYRLGRSINGYLGEPDAGCPKNTSASNRVCISERKWGMSSGAAVGIGPIHAHLPSCHYSCGWIRAVESATLSVGELRWPRMKGRVARSCTTSYDLRMTMLSFRVDDRDANEAQRWAEALGIDRSELLREALRRHLNQLAAEGDADRWAATPLDDGERALCEIAEWGPAEDWSDWATDAAR